MTCEWQTLDYGIDWMHSGDGGAGHVGLAVALQVGFSAEQRKKFNIGPRGNYNDVAIYRRNLELAFAQFRSCLSSEFARLPRSPMNAHMYKTAETRTVILRFFPALRLRPEITPDNGFAENFMNYVIFTKLVGNFSTKPLPSVGVLFLGSL